MEYGIQLYSVRDCLRADYKATLKTMADLGYKMVETIVTDVPATDVAAWCQEYGLKVSGTHTGLSHLTDDKLAQTIADHKAMGCKLLIIPGCSLGNAKSIDESVAIINKVQPILAAEGITLAFHNHSGEFLPNEDGQIPYDELLSRTAIKLQLDTYWAYNAGKDPVALMDQLADRLVAIHIKDGDANGKGCPLGMGTAPVKAVWAKAKAMNLPMIVESETQTPDGPTEARICIDFLKAMGD